MMALTQQNFTGRKQWQRRDHQLEYAKQGLKYHRSCVCSPVFPGGNIGREMKEECWLSVKVTVTLVDIQQCVLLTCRLFCCFLPEYLILEGRDLICHFNVSSLGPYQLLINTRVLQKVPGKWN